MVDVTTPVDYSVRELVPVAVRKYHADGMKFLQ